MDTNNQSFNWLRRECLLINSRRFHIFEPLSADDLVYKCVENNVMLKGDYADFLKEFGSAKLFADYRDAPTVSVYPLKNFRRHVCENGRSFIGFGFRSYQSVFFDEDAICSVGESKVYVVNKKEEKEVSSFSDWLKSSYEWAKSKYSLSKWKGVVDGPKPFSSNEMKIVEARSLFSWRHVGFAEDGDAVFKIKNNSALTIPYLTIGVRDKKGEILVGAVWLDVGHIGPGEEAYVKKDCYKDRIPKVELDVFDVPEPIPEKREAYWEFGRPL